MFNKLAVLKNRIIELPALAVAYSGGVDSSLLLKIAYDCLGNRAVAITAAGINHSSREIEDSKDFCRKLGARQYIIETEPLEIPGFRVNSYERCYLCKKDILGRIKEKARELGIETVADGSNQDDLADFRPGRKAVEEQGIMTPLLDAALTKEEIRQLAKHLNLACWDKPAAACLASRFPFGETINAEKLMMVEQAENYLAELGFKQLRVRMHGKLARIELGVDERIKIADYIIMDKINEKLKELGFTYATFDLGGYKCGG
ncbi:MAG: ATP-dependent sacrificial sulfur transferase LarE [Syntrophomonas sp.]